MKKPSILIVLVLAFALLFALTACTSSPATTSTPPSSAAPASTPPASTAPDSTPPASTAPDSTPSASTAPDSTPPASAPPAATPPAGPMALPTVGAPSITTSYKIGMNAWGTMPVLAFYGDEAQYALKDVLGMTTVRASDDNNADKEVQNIQNFISQGVDGLCIQAYGGTTVPAMASAAAAEKIPFVLCQAPPTDDIYKDLCANNPYFAGVVVSDLKADGSILGQKALDDGCKTACLIGGNIGDPNMDNRSAGFQQSFKDGGGAILDEERCNDNSECLAKATAMLSANKNVDCVYIMVADYVQGTITAIQQLGLTNVKCYLSAVDAGSAQYVTSGQIVAASGGTCFGANFGPTLLLNLMDGHPIKDDSGNAPFFRVPSFLVTKDNVDAYISIFFGTDSHGTSPELIQNLCWRYNPNVTYQTYVDTFANYLNMPAILAAHGQ